MVLVLVTACLSVTTDRSGDNRNGSTPQRSDHRASVPTSDRQAMASDDGEPALSGGITGLGEHLYLVPGVIHKRVAKGKHWRSDLVLHNPGRTPVSVRLLLLRRDRDNTQPASSRYSVAAGSSLRLANLIGGVFQLGTASGAVLLSASAELLVTGYTYLQTPGGFVGQSVPGVALRDWLRGERPVALIRLSRNAELRTNIGFTNLSGQRLDLEVDLFSSDGQRLARRPYSFRPFELWQADDIFGIDVDAGYATVRAKDEQALYYTYASVIDSRSDDPALVLPATASSDTALYLPAVVRASGSNGDVWRTDLEILSIGATAATVRLELLGEEDSRNPASVLYTVAGGTSARLVDVLDLFDQHGIKALRIVPLSGAVTASGRSYRDLGDRRYGQSVPVRSDDQAITTGQTARLTPLATSPDATTGFRTTIGLINACSEPIEVDLRLLDGAGGLLGTSTISLAPFAVGQLENLLAKLTPHKLRNAAAELSSQSPGARFFAYASVINNRSGDPIYLPAIGPLGSTAARVAPPGP